MVATKQFNDEVVSKISEHTILFSSAISHEKVLAKFNKDRLFIFEAFRKIYTNNIAFSGYSIGEVGLDILLKLNAKNIYIVGLDLALNQETGESHSKDSNSGGIKVFDLNKEDDREFFSLGNSTLKVKGNSKDEVVVSSTFYLSINYLNQNILINKKDDVNIYNLSENGAYFINTKYLNIEEIDIDEFKDVDYSNLKGIFEQFSKTTLDKEAIENSNFDYNYLKYGHFYLMLENYYSFIIPYLNYHFNDIKIKNESKKVDKIKDTFLLQLENLIDDYLLSIKNVLNID